MGQTVSLRSGLKPSDQSTIQKFLGGAIKFKEISRISSVVDTLQSNTWNSDVCMSSCWLTVQNVAALCQIVHHANVLTGHTGKTSY